MQEGEYMAGSSYVDHIIGTSTFRRNVYNLVPDNATRILDFGCGNGALLLRLQRDKNCTDLYGIEIDRNVSLPLKQHISRLWNINIEEDFSQLEEYQGFFDYIIMHDVVEHLYDPWFTLSKIRTLLSENGTIIIATPNIHHWRLQYQIHSGLFPYGHGLWHTGHLRWYTPISFIELLLTCSLEIREIFLEIPDNIDLARLDRAGTLRHLQIPPPEFQKDPAFPNRYTVSYEQDIRRYFPVFYAHKIIGHCKKGELLFEPKPMAYDCARMEAIRQALNLPFNIFNPPRMTPIIGNWC